MSLSLKNRKMDRAAGAVRNTGFGEARDKQAPSGEAEQPTDVEAGEQAVAGIVDLSGAPGPESQPSPSEQAAGRPVRRKKTSAPRGGGESVTSGQVTLEDLCGRIPAGSLHIDIGIPEPVAEMIRSLNFAAVEVTGRSLNQRKLLEAAILAVPDDVSAGAFVDRNYPFHDSPQVGSVQAKVSADVVKHLKRAQLQAGMAGRAVATAGLYFVLSSIDVPAGA